MADFHVTAVPIGKVKAEDLEPALARVAKVLRRPIELRERLPLPHEAQDSERGQYRAATLMARLGAEVLKLRQGRLVGASDPQAKPPFRTDAFIFVTDVDLFTARSEGVTGALMSKKQCAVASIRRLREAFYKRKADPNRQRSRLVKEILRFAGRLAGLSECADPNCVMAPSKSVVDIDAKEERFCRGCEQSLFEGKLLI